MRITTAALAGLLAAGLATTALAQGAPNPSMPNAAVTSEEIAPGVPALGIESSSTAVLALLTPADDPLAYTDMLEVGSVGSPGMVAFDLQGASDADIATGSIAPSK